MDNNDLSNYDEVLQDISLMVQKNSVEVSNNSVTGIIYWRFKDRYFPELNWNDLICSVLSMWTDSICQLINNNRKRVILNFMEGPFYILTVKRNTRLGIKLYEDFGTPVLLESLTINEKQLYMLLHDASSILLSCLECGNCMENHDRTQIDTTSNMDFIKMNSPALFQDYVKIKENCKKIFEYCDSDMEY
ncbi:MAG: hypothetical protein Q4G68_06850 [Planctomycetia bacterium]|nr:hypothetical protein [Planctomycetia bacterium]